MSKRYTFGMLAVSAAVAFALAGCSGSPEGGTSAGEQQVGATSSATEFAGLATRGLEVDFDRLASPEAAVNAGELIVRGKVVDVIDGITYSKGEQAGRANAYATLVVEVDASLKSSVAKGTKVYAQLNKSSAADAAQLSKAAKGLPVVVVLDDISGWAPAPGVTVVRPKGMPATGPLYLAFPDGLFLQGASDKAMVGVHAHTDELGSAWGAPQTLDQYWATLAKAAQ